MGKSQRYQAAVDEHLAALTIGIYREGRGNRALGVGIRNILQQTLGVVCITFVVPKSPQGLFFLEVSNITDAFSKYHPAVNFIFFMGAFILGALIMHPLYLASAVICALIYLLLLNRGRLKYIPFILPLLILIAVINPLLNTRGAHILFYVFGRAYTLEALLYGVATAGIFAIMLLWLGCYSIVMTCDKFTALFGGLIPSVSLILVMVFRMVPALINKGKHIINTRHTLGKGFVKGTPIRAGLKEGATVISALTSFALEGGIITADSMRCRGYGSTKKTCYMPYRFTIKDGLVLAVEILLLGITVFALISGQGEATFLPKIQIAGISYGLISYTAYMLIPTILYLEELIKWNISISKI